MRFAPLKDSCFYVLRAVVEMYARTRTNKTCSKFGYFGVTPKIPQVVVVKRIAEKNFEQVLLVLRTGKKHGIFVRNTANLVSDYTL